MGNDFTDKGVNIAVGILVVGILAAFLLPISIGTMNAPDKVEINQTVGNNEQVTAHLYSNVTNVDSVNNDIDVTLTDTQGDTNTTKSISNLSVGENTTVSMPDGDITVNNTEQGTDYAVVSYEHPKDYGWSNGSAAMWGLLPLFFVLALVLFAIAKAKGFS